MSNVMKYLSMAMSMSAMAGDMFYSDTPIKKTNGVCRNVRTEQKINRNEQCPCGSGKKYKKCCLGANEM